MAKNKNDLRYGPPAVAPVKHEAPKPAPKPAPVVKPAAPKPVEKPVVEVKQQ